MKRHGMWHGLMGFWRLAHFLLERVNWECGNRHVLGLDIFVLFCFVYCILFYGTGWIGQEEGGGGLGKAYVCVCVCSSYSRTTIF